MGCTCPQDRPKNDHYFWFIDVRLRQFSRRLADTMVWVIDGRFLQVQALLRGPSWL